MPGRENVGWATQQEGWGSQEPDVRRTPGLSPPAAARVRGRRAAGCHPSHLPAGCEATTAGLPDRQVGAPAAQRAALQGGWGGKQHGSKQENDPETAQSAASGRGRQHDCRRCGAVQRYRAPLAAGSREQQLL